MPKYLLVLDFDGTVAETFKPSPNGVGVEKAYELAIEKLFGEEGLIFYLKSGGLKNRNPGEVIRGLESFGQVSVEEFVQVKLSFFLNEIGHDWPKPCKGFVPFYRDIAKMKNLEVAILSSGHAEFIKKTFSVWGLDPPQIMLTDDDLRGYNPPLPLALASKPSPFLFDLIQEGWEGRRQHMIMFGDDPRKDGKLASNAGVPFGLFSCQNWEFIENSFQFSDWREISKFLKKETTQKLISRGLATSEIIFANTW